MEDLLAVKAEFNDFFKERSDEVNCALLAILSGEHVLFLGPPGTAKSLLSKCICEAVEGADFYYYLLTKYTTPEEIFGPLSIKSLKEDEFKRKTDGYLPSASIAFLDEIFKANSSILNSLLTILNERQFHNGMNVMKVPLLSVFGASNELPEEEESLGALYDRFLFRCMVDYIQEDRNFRQLVFGERRDFKLEKKLSLEYIKSVKSRASAVKLDADTKSIIMELRKEFRRRGVPISDRRWLKIVDVLKVAAASIGQDRVDRTMVLLLKHMLWDKPDQRDAVRDLLIDMVATVGENFDTLDKDLSDLRLSLEKTAEDIGMGEFPFEVYCVDCNLPIYSMEDLKNHDKEHPNHFYRDPRYPGQSNYRCDYKKIIELLNEDPGYRAVKGKLPFDVYCVHCGRKIDLYEELEEHYKLYPNHYYKDPRHPTNDSYRIDYKRLIHLLNNPDFSVDMSSIFGNTKTAMRGENSRELYKKEIAEMYGDSESKRRSLAEERERLEKALINNSWVTIEDRNDVLARYHGKKRKIGSAGSETDAYKQGAGIS